MARKNSGGASQNALEMVGVLGSVLGVSEEEMNRAKVLRALGELGGAVAQEDKLRFEGKAFVLPENFKGNLRGAAQYLEKLDEQENTTHRFVRDFRYRPNDVSHALGLAMKKLFGTTGIGKETIGFFSRTPPTFVTINVGPNEQAQVISGQTEFSPLDAVITVANTYDNEVGFIVRIFVEAPRRYRAEVEGLFIVIEEELKAHSIYRGKVINGAADPQFLDVSRVNPERVIYTDEVMTQLKANIWSLIEHSDAMRQHKLPLKRSVLIYGPYGTGKSLAAALTAQKAELNGWTFIQVRPADDLKAAMQTAQLYAPAVVFFEDIDVVAENGTPRDVSELLDVFDGIANKGVEVITVMTTNFVDRIQKGLLRPGRMDAVIEIAAMDSAGFQRLIESLVDPGMLLEPLDFAAIAEAYEGFLPAFAKEAADRAVRYAIARAEGEAILLSTADFVGAANGLRPQLELMEGAGEAKQQPTLDAAIKSAVTDAVHGLEVFDPDYAAEGKDGWATSNSNPTYVLRRKPNSSN